MSMAVTSDQDSLLTLKAQITSSDPSTMNIIARNWSATTSVCNWVGVSCDSSSNNQRVIALNISDMGLTGTIPPQLGNLSFLVSLDISRNYFHGQLPEEMAGLRGLRYVYLSDNSFTGRIPLWFGVFQELRHLVFSHFLSSIYQSWKLCIYLPIC